MSKVTKPKAGVKQVSSYWLAVQQIKYLDKCNFGINSVIFQEYTDMVNHKTETLLDKLYKNHHKNNIKEEIK